MNIPNILTAIRFLIVPVFGFFLYKEQYLVSVILYTVGGITDILDGYIARKFNLITSFGKLADPIADKFMQLTALVFLTIQGLIFLPILIVVLAKEIFMAIGSIMLYKNGKNIVAANWYGKLATVIFFFSIVMTIIIRMGHLGNFSTDLLLNVFVGIAVLSTMFAFFMYSLTYRRIRKDTKVSD